jgi:hypothetical protein
MKGTATFDRLSKRLGFMDDSNLSVGDDGKSKFMSDQFAQGRKHASEVFHVGKKEQDIIRTHMWPLTLHTVPRSREAVIVCMADKWCSLQETIFMRKKGK